jgi:hypothetical protein
MAKRFISTELFDDDWFMGLKPNSKLLWVYFITKCDHAGIISFNEKLCKFQTGLNDVQSCLKELKSRLVKISDTQYFIPKFIYFQYPDFPNSRVNQQKGAIKILQKYGLLTENEQLKITSLNDVESLSKTYDNDNGNDSVNVNGNIETRKQNFKDKLKEFRTEYEIPLLKSFFEYWTESSHNGKKMRFEKEKTFEIGLRLKNWKRNDKKFNTDGKSTSIIDQNRAVAQNFIERLNGGSDLQG